MLQEPGDHQRLNNITDGKAVKKTIMTTITPRQLNDRLQQGENPWFSTVNHDKGIGCELSFVMWKTVD